MKFLSLFLIIILIFFTNSCSKKKPEYSVIEKDDIEEQMIDAYTKGVEALEDGDAFFAAKKFNEAEILFPQSEWAAKAAIMAAYSYYSQGYYSNSIEELNNYLKQYPNDPQVDYAHYMLAINYFETIVDEKKDLTPLLKAKKGFQYILSEYPNSDFALDAKFKIEYVNDILASKEMYLGRHYIKKEKWIAAINRFKTLIDDYGTTVYVEEALHRLVEIHYKIGLVDEGQKYAKLLGYNYLSGEWYKQSYRVFNKDYEIKKVKKTDKSDKLKIKDRVFKKFKSLYK